MKLRFVKVNSSGNTTVFLLDQTDSKDYLHITSEIMKYTGVGAEQIAFIMPDKTPPHIQMLGGEFCGNASRSFAAWLKLMHQDFQSYKKLSKAETVKITASGCDLPLAIDLTPLENNYSCHAKIAMPLPREILHGTHPELGKYSLINFDGIVHIVLYNAKPDESIFPVVHQIIRQQKIQSPCIGIMFFNEKLDFLTPLVYVKKLKTFTWEKSCGSGSAALIAAYADKQKDTIMKKVRQPGGELQIEAIFADNKIEAIKLSGPVEITAAGYIYL